MRSAEVVRETKETKIRIVFNPDQRGEITVDTGLAFFDHMLNSFARHGGFSLVVSAKGDLEVDPHHTVEDVGIVLGSAIKQAVSDGRGIRRFAHAIIPMDESRATAALDVGGRGYLVMDGAFTGIMTGGIPNDLFEHFLYSLCINAGITAHVIFSGVNDHHKCEAIFKAFGVALGKSVALVPGYDDVPSTKGTL
ncbi:MAG: imidazoleglycerol-phosphate dehydratase HisB [Methanocorpusculum sp.]|uniref:Imidazoleglycerol-phosphate dehydratase n=1 Tax=Methanocorpusculum petauri TaxID=3002863 RepID=A0ABT4IJX3_9EURY|nr:imidazoleglycerol-phosphate dehydratase HisB [Methanocorpusculum petauri]MCZ9312198.1 imidazoleglycerol-phosphate dehydratase HisB [Methanocorpusculum sp.]MCZ0861393.1 imidazoleglycerol-phosphate dehydratase HisB [Methanocorpusculum petauri]MDE2444073.1 imidazoleglycerol-phosphate dehydratase HisB [Methanocorpusculum sp.]MDE2518213.1 imidazoleglycerol-phosphate dehydratase HisB [Methanocorpusculum sp.]MDE2523332.1 imidazoleglycerol-phosphate dehydratase HisB [Methanocorpusculum sp.]